jgi:hypothetical protein
MQEQAVNGESARAVIETQALGGEIESDGSSHHKHEGSPEQNLFHPDSLVPFQPVLHPDDLEPFHPVYKDSSVLLTESGRFKLPTERLLQLQRIWRSLDQIALSSPRPNEHDWNQAMKRYRPAAAAEGVSVEKDDNDWNFFCWSCP